MAKRNRRSGARLKALKHKPNYCPLCGNYDSIQGHHVYKYTVFKEQKGYDDIVWLCAKCHKELEEIIRERENDVLRNKPELYEKTWIQFKEMKNNDGSRT